MSDEWTEYDEATRVEREAQSQKPPVKEPPKEIIKEIPIEHETIKKVTETKQVPVRDTVIEKVEVIKEVPVDREVIKEVPIEKIVYKDRDPSTSHKVTLKEWDASKPLTWAMGGIITLLMFYGGSWIHAQEFSNLIKAPEKVVKKVPVAGPTKTKWKTRWKTRKVVDKSLKRENRVLRENLATAKNRINRLLAEIARPKHYTCRYSHRLKVIHSQK